MLTPASAAEVKAGLESKSRLSKFLQAREYRKSAKEALRFVKVTLAHHITQQTNVSHGLMNYRPFQTELKMRCSDKGRWD